MNKDLVNKLLDGTHVQLNKEFNYYLAQYLYKIFTSQNTKLLRSNQFENQVVCMLSVCENN